MSAYIDFDHHKKILGTLFVVFSLFHFVFFFLGVLFFSEFLPIFIDDQEALLILNIVKYAIITITFIISVPAFIAGVGLLYKKDWALTLSFIIGIISLPAFPIWTFIGIYSIVIFILYQRDGHKPAAGEVNTV